MGLRPLPKNERESRIAQAQDLAEEGHSKTAIAKQLGVSEGAVRKWLKNTPLATPSGYSWDVTHKDFGKT